MFTPDEIMISIFGYCDSSCLYPLLLTSKHIKDLAEIIIPSPNVLVRITFWYKDLSKEFRFMSKEKYKIHKKKLKLSRVFDNYECNIIEHVRMERIKDIKLIRMICFYNVAFFNSFYFDI